MLLFLLHEMKIDLKFCTVKTLLQTGEGLSSGNCSLVVLQRSHLSHCQVSIRTWFGSSVLVRHVPGHTNICHDRGTEQNFLLDADCFPNGKHFSICLLLAAVKVKGCWFHASPMQIEVGGIGVRVFHPFEHTPAEFLKEKCRNADNRIATTIAFGADFQPTR